MAADKAKDVAAVAADKAKDAAELTRITMAIAGEQREIDKNYRTIGEWFVSEYEGEIPDAVRDLVEAVNTSKAKIAELEASKPRKDDGAEVEAEAPARRSAPSAARPLTASSAPSAAPPWATEFPPIQKTSPPAEKPAGSFFLFRRSAAYHATPRRRGWTGRCPHPQSRTWRSSGPGRPCR